MDHLPWFARLGGRRFILTVGCGVICSILLAWGKLTDASYTTIILGTVAVYISANTFQKRQATLAEKEIKTTEIEAAKASNQGAES